MPDSIGAHLLGREPSRADDRNYDLGVFLRGGSVLDAQLAAVQRSMMNTKSVKRWAKTITAAVYGLLNPPFPPLPPPDPTPMQVTWLDDDDPVLDQGDTPKCVGFTGADWLNALPVDDHVDNAEGDRIYDECKVIDGDNQDGSTIHSLAQALVNRGRLKTYAFAFDIEDVWTFVKNHGPICWGIGWTDSMFTPDASGLVVPSGADVGGHAIIQYGVDDNDEGELLNHWGESWGVNGRFKMRKADLAERLANGGEALAGVELAA